MTSEMVLVELLNMLADFKDRLADSEQHVVSGRDPLVRAPYPGPSRELEGIAVRLDVAPSLN
jgi:hypothetical protein